MSHFTRTFTLAVAALAIGVIAPLARAQYSVNPGAAPGGGNIVVGSGTALGSVITGDGTLSPGGFDILTYQPGSFATGTSITVNFTSSGNQIFVSGTVLGGTGGDAMRLSGTNNSVTVNLTGTNTLAEISGGDGAATGSGRGGVGIFFMGSTGFTVTNNGLIFGGDGHDATQNDVIAGNGGDGIETLSTTNLTNVMITNSGGINGEDGGSGLGFNNSAGGDGGEGVFLGTIGTVSGVILINKEEIGGGDGGFSSTSGSAFAGNGGSAFFIRSGSGMSSVSITNDFIMHGGDGGNVIVATGTQSGTGGAAIYLLNGTAGAVSGVTIANNGQALGGDGGTPGASGTGGAGGDGLFIGNQQGAITNITINNAGFFEGGDGGSGTFANSAGGAGGNGVLISSTGAGGTVSSVTFTGSLAFGGEGGNAGSAAIDGNGGAAFKVLADASVNGITVKNTGGGVFLGGEMEEEFSPNATGGDGGSALYIAALEGTVSNVDIENFSGAFVGSSGADVSGSSSSAGNGGNAIFISGSGGISNLMINNAGFMFGGNGGDGRAVGVVGSGAGGIAILVTDFAGDINGVSLMNTGWISGGTGGSSTSGSVHGGSGNYAINFSTNQALKNTGIFNGAGGLIQGGNGGASGPGVGGPGGGDAIELVAQTNITNLSVANAGMVSGGTGGPGDDSPGPGSVSGGLGGRAMNVAANTISGMTISNSGTFAGGNGGNSYDGAGAIGVFATGINGLAINNQGLIVGGTGGFSQNHSANPGGIGIYLNTDADGVTNLSVFNSGRIIGGQGGSTGMSGTNPGSGVDAFTMSNGGDITGMLFVNTGLVQGGASGTAPSPLTNGARGGYGMEINVSGATGITQSKIENYGTITGGNSFGAGENAGVGIILDHESATGADTGFTVDNYGFITGGNGVQSGSGGTGLYIATLGAVYNNWGVIASGTGIGNLPAINVTGSNNLVALRGHSAVYGQISGQSPNAGNVLALDFTGMSPAAQAMLIAQVEAQGNLTNFTGTFTVRGVTYTVDPMVIGFGMSSYQLQGVTPNQRAIGASLDSLPFNPAVGSPLFTLLNAIDQSGNVPAALDALSPANYSALGDIGISQSDFLTNSIDSRLNNIRNGSESIDTSGVGGTTVASLTKDDDKSSKEIQPAAATPVPDRWGFFATGNGLFFRGDRRDVGLAGEDKSNSAGTLVGVDGKVGNNGVLGALFAYDNTSAELGSAGSHASIESYSGGIYGDWHGGGFYVNALGVYTRNSYQLNRSILLPGFLGAASGNTKGNQYTANLDGGYDWNATDRFSVGPVLGAQYVHLGIDGFSETGQSAASLAVGSQDINSLQSRLGAHASYHLLTSPVSSFALDFHAAWQHEYLNDSRAIGASFQTPGLAPFAIQTGSPRRDAGVVGLGLNATFHDRLTLFVDYELEMWSASSFDQTVNAGARISF